MSESQGKHQRLAELDDKLNSAIDKKNEAQKEQDGKQIELKFVKEKTIKHQKEILSLKQLQQRQLEEIQNEQDDNLRQKAIKLKQLMDQVEEMKMKVQIQKNRRRELEEKIEVQEEQRNIISIRLDQLGKQTESNMNLVFSSADMETEILKNQRLFEKLNIAKNLQISLIEKNESYIDEQESLGLRLQKLKLQIAKEDQTAKRDELQLKLDQIKANNKKEFDVNLSLLEKLKFLQISVQTDTTKSFELIEIANLLKDQNKFEKQSRKIQQMIERWEDEQRSQQDAQKELLTNFKFVCKESGAQNQKLEEDLIKYGDSLHYLVTKKNDLSDEIRVLMMKVCNKSPSELKIDMIDSYLKNLSEYSEKLQQKLVISSLMQAKCLGFSRKCFEFEKKVKDDLVIQSSDYLQDNESLIKNINGNLKGADGKLSSLVSRLNNQNANTEALLLKVESQKSQFQQAQIQFKRIKSQIEEEKLILQDSKESQEINKVLLAKPYQPKTSSVPVQSDISDYVTIKKVSKDQNDRLKDLKVNQIEDLNKLIAQLEDELSKLEDSVKGNQVDACRSLLKEGLSGCDELSAAISKLEDKLKQLKERTGMLDPEEAKEIENDIIKVQNDLDDLKAAKDNIYGLLIELSNMSDSDIIKHQKDLKQSLDELNNLKNNDLKERKKDIDAIKEKMRNMIRNKRFKIRKQCQDELEKAGANLRDLIIVLDDTRQKIDSTNKDKDALVKAYAYNDLERKQEIDEKITQPLTKSTNQNGIMEQEKNKLQDRIDSISDEFNDLSNQLIGNKVFSLKSSPEDTKDEVDKQWTDCHEKIMQVSEDIKNELNKAQGERDKVKQVKKVLNDLDEKYRNKNIVYRECQQKHKEKQKILDDSQQALDKMGQRIDEVEQLMSKLVIPENTSPQKQSPVNKNKLQKQNDQINRKIKDLKQKKDQLQEKLNKIVKNLPLIGDQIVNTEELNGIKDQLDKLDTELNNLKEEIKGCDKELDGLETDVNTAFHENKRGLFKEADEAQNNLENDLAALEALYKEVAEKSRALNGKIKQGMDSGSEELCERLKVLSKEAEIIGKDLSIQEKHKNDLKDQEKKNRDALKQLKAMPKKEQNAQDTLDLIGKFNETRVGCAAVTKELQRIKGQLDGMYNEVDEKLRNRNEMQKLKEQLEEIFLELQKNKKLFLQKLDDAKLLTKKLEAVLDEMAKGIKTDYKLKASFIMQEKEDLDKIKKQIEELDIAKEKIEEKEKAVKGKANTKLDTEGFQDLITESLDIIQLVKNADKKSTQCGNKLKQIRKDIGVADVPPITKLREQEALDFNTRIRKLDQDYSALKSLLTVKKDDQNSDLIKDINELGQQIIELKDECQKYKTILNNEILIYIPQPKALENLETLRNVIKKLLELGVNLNGSNDRLDQLYQTILKYKKLIGGLDLLKRYNELKYNEENQRKRLEVVKTRLERIEKGAQDCDGYTSDTEEATFIDTLLSEIPEMKQKQGQAVSLCDQNKGSLDSIKGKVEAIARNEEKGSVVEEVSGSLDSIEGFTQTNERTVVFLEKLMDKLEDHFLQMDVKKKLEKRQRELKELHGICQDFEDQLNDVHDQINQDMALIDQKKNSGELEYRDEHGKQISLREEFDAVNNELQAILIGVVELQEETKAIQKKRDEVEYDFNTQIVSTTIFKETLKITNKHDIFQLLKANGWMKKRIVDLIKALKELGRKVKETRLKYQVQRVKLERQNKPKKIYKAVKGDKVDELFGDYINNLNCPVPIKRLGNNQYTFGTKKIFAKIINGKLVIRVGGGYMGIEEFMQYYGQQELAKIQKQEYMNAEEYEYGTISDEEGETKGTNIDILSSNKTTSVVGIGDVRKALRSNMIEITTYKEHSSMGIGGMGTSTQKGVPKKVVKGEKEALERQLKTLEKSVATKETTTTKGGVIKKTTSKTEGKLTTETRTIVKTTTTTTTTSKTQK